MNKQIKGKKKRRFPIWSNKFYLSRVAYYSYSNISLIINTFNEEPLHKMKNAHFKTQIKP